MSDYIDVTALWHVALYGAVFGGGIVACYALAIAGGSRVAVARERGSVAAAPAALAGLMLTAVAAAIVLGLYVMLDK